MIKPASASSPSTGIEDELIALFADLADGLGFPRSYGQIYGLLYASAQPLSFTDIQERLKLSKGSVSQGLRTLRDAKVIRHVEGPDWRREHFAPELELRLLLAGLVADSIQPRLQQGARRVAALKARVRGLPGSKTEELRVLAARIKKLSGWHKRAGMLIPLVSRFLS